MAITALRSLTITEVLSVPVPTRPAMAVDRPAPCRLRGQDRSQSRVNRVDPSQRRSPDAHVVSFVSSAKSTPNDEPKRNRKCFEVRCSELPWARLAPPCSGRATLAYHRRCRRDLKNPRHDRIKMEHRDLFFHPAPNRTHESNRESQPMHRPGEAGSISRGGTSAQVVATCSEG